MEIVTRHYDELTADELYDILRLRSAVFVVEQNCVYQDLDGKDKASYHLWLRDDGGEIVAYVRVLPQGISFDDAASIGRVVCIKRRRGYATMLIREGIRLAQEKFSARRISIEAQLYARSLYEKLGFVQVSDEFLEDGIPHIKMTWETPSQPPQGEETSR